MFQPVALTRLRCPGPTNKHPRTAWSARSEQDGRSNWILRVGGYSKFAQAAAVRPCRCVAELPRRWPSPECLLRDAESCRSDSSDEPATRSAANGSQAQTISSMAMEWSAPSDQQSFQPSSLDAPGASYRASAQPMLAKSPPVPAASLRAVRLA